jgi:hypothetical protein
MAGYVQKLSIHSVLNPDVLDGFASITMASANFRDALVYRLWRQQGVRFQEDTPLTQALRFYKHENGNLITIKHLADRPWSRKLQRTPCGPDSENSETVLTTMAVNNEFREHPLLWQANKSVGDGEFGSSAQRLPNGPHGLNDYSDYDWIAFLSALNPRTDHFRFLTSRGVDADAVRRAIYGSAVYQSAMRTSIRNPESSTGKTLIVPDASAARYLEEAFPRSRVEKPKTRLIDLDRTANHRGRPREYNSSKERQRAHRKRIKESEQQQSLQQKSFPYVVKNSWDEQGTSDERHENSISINTHFVTQADVHGTVYRDKTSNVPGGYLSGGNSELFLEFLAHSHNRTVDSKEANVLISPAIFDLDHPKAEGETNRGLKNIVAVRHLWMDFENGDLPPEEIAKLFPHIRLAVLNTYNHTNENPRFRVVIPFDKAISAEHYIALYNNQIAKIVDAGFSVGKSRGGKRSRLDVSKESPASLFYLPSQAKNPAESFFYDYHDDKRQILDPMTWVRNSVVQFTKVDDARRNTLQTSPKKVDQAAVEKATTIWRESSKYPREGNGRFFNYALALRSAGMLLNDIEQKLREEAEFGRSPKDRRDQIPWIMKTLRASLKKSA